MSDALSSSYPELGAGGFTRVDGTIEFYGRLNALLKSSDIVLDLGAGRGRQFETDSAYRRSLLAIQGKVQRLVGVDVDEAVLRNEFLDEAFVYDGVALPFADDTFDVIFCDWVLEHIEAPDIFAREIGRVIRPGGWFCARTPTKYSLTATASRLAPNRMHSQLLETIQAGQRKSEDVFPAYYRLNTHRSLRRFFPPAQWRHCSYEWTPEPAYHFGSSLMVRLMRAAHHLKAPFAGENLLVFIQRTS